MWSALGDVVEVEALDEPATLPQASVANRTAASDAIDLIGFMPPMMGRPCDGTMTAHRSRLEKPTVSVDPRMRL